MSGMTPRGVVPAIAPTLPRIGFIYPPPFAPPPIPPVPLALAVVGAAAALITIGLTVRAAVDANRAERDLQKAKDLYEKVLQRPVSTGDKRELIPAPATGGLSAGVWYEYDIDYRVTFNGSDISFFGFVRQDTALGVFRGVEVREVETAFNFFKVDSRGEEFLVSANKASFTAARAVVTNLRRSDGLPDPVAPPTLGDSIPSGYSRTPEKDRRQAPATTPPPTPQKPREPFSVGVRPSLGIGAPAKEPTTGLVPPAPDRRQSPPPQSPPVTPPTPTTTPKTPTVPSGDPNKEKDKAPFIPKTPATTDDIRRDLTGLGAIIALIGANTLPDALKNAAKAGSCETMKSPSCTKDMEDRIKDPIKQDTGNLLQNVGAVASIVDATSNKLDGIKTFLEKVARAAKLDKIYNLLTFITVIHNAQMLSSSLATTLMDSLSLGLATIGIKDENESPIDIQSIINKSVEDTVKGIIGTANYTTISARWKNAVRVYQAAANIAYQVRSLWDSARSLAELTGANVGKIGNALRRDGVVAENAYGAMADNPLMVNNAMTKLQNLEEAASHINSITSEAYGVTETVAQIKKDQDDFKKLAKEGLSSPTPIVNDQQKAKDDAAKLVSVSPSISRTDLVKPD